jgi:uncharacterized protein YkwD
MKSTNPVGGLRAIAAKVGTALLLVTATGCAAGLAANTRSPGTVDKGYFVPVRPGEASYGVDPALTCPKYGVNGLVEELLQDGLKGKTVPQPDGRLCAIADTLLGWPESEDLVPENVRLFLGRYFGLPASFGVPSVRNLDTDEAKNIAPLLADSIINFAGNAQQPRYGLITTRLRAKTTRVALVLWDQTVELAPIPRKLAPGTSATLSGTLLGLQNPKVQIVDVVGKLEVVPSQPDQSFKAQISCGDKAGRILVQIIGERDGGNVTAAKFPITCGTDQPVSAKMPEADEKAADPAQTEKQLVDLINADRTAAGLPPLVYDPDLSGVARALAENRAGGRGTTSTELQQRLKEKDISTPMVLASEGQAFNAEEAHARFSESARDRANEMTSEVNQIGVGAAAGPPVGGRPSIILTELFIKVLAPPDPVAIKAKLYEGIARKRADARANPTAKDPVLEDVAQKYAEGLATYRGSIPKDKESELVAPLYKALGSVNIMGGVKQDPLEFSEEPGVIGNGKLLGVGVAVGSSIQFGKNSTFVVVLLGSAKEAPAPVKRPVKKKK